VQFSRDEDFDKYPRNNDADIAMLTAAGVDAVFEPTSLYIRSGGFPLAPVCFRHRFTAHTWQELLYLPLTAHMIQGDLPLIYAGIAGEGNAAGSDADVVVGADQPEHASGHETFVQVERLQQGLCGRSRPYFFRGVATVRH